MKTISMSPDTLAHHLRVASEDYERCRVTFAATAHEYEARADRQTDPVFQAEDRARCEGHTRTAAQFAYQRDKAKEWAEALEAASSISVRDEETIVAHVEAA